MNLIDTQDDKEKFNLLYEKYKNLLYYIAVCRTHSNEAAEDCVQETFFHIAKHFDKIDKVESDKTKGYLATVVTGFAIDYYNKENKLNQISTDESTTDLSYFESYDTIEIFSAIDKVLSEEEKNYLYLKYVYGYKSSEIAEMYSLSDTLARKKIERAKAKLKKYYEEEK